MQVQKLLFSATLSHDPEQLASLELVLPTLFVAEHGSSQHIGSDVDVRLGDGDGDGEDSHEGRYSTPATLKEHMVVCGAQHKPLVVLHFLLVQRFQRVLVFVSSREAAHR